MTANEIIRQNTLGIWREDAEPVPRHHHYWERRPPQFYRDYAASWTYYCACGAVKRLFDDDSLL